MDSATVRALQGDVNVDPPCQPPAPTTEDLTQPFLDSLKSHMVSSTAGINNFFLSRTGRKFPDFFNANVPTMDAWNTAVHKEKLVPSRPIKILKPAAFDNVWNLVQQFFGINEIHLIHFLALNSIITNETGGIFEPISEVSRGLGIKYFMQYNVGPNITAGKLFRLPTYLAAHASLQPSVPQNTTDPRWDTKLWPIDAPTMWNRESYVDNGFIMNADFYKYRGRGFIQTTWRSNYKPIVDWIKTYRGSNSVIARFRDAWAGRNSEEILTTSTTQEWDTLFLRTGGEVAAIAIRIHNRKRVDSW